MDLCPICLSLPDPGASISHCRHIFCLNCIEQWSSRENRCPLCKIRFDQIVWTDSEGKTNSKDVPTKNQSSDGQTVRLILSINVTEVMEIQPSLTFEQVSDGKALDGVAKNTENHRSILYEDNDQGFPFSMWILSCATATATPR